MTWTVSKPDLELGLRLGLDSFKTGVRFEKFRIANLLPIKVRKIESHCSKTITISNLTEEVFLRLEIICAVRVRSWKSLC